jgi:cAMP-dependent protein kinase regulator
VGLKNWMKGLQKPQESDLESDIEDLIILERYEEAEERLRSKLKENPHDLHGHLKLADVYIQQRNVDKAVDLYIYVAEEYAQDGFHDRAIALLNKGLKVMPADERLRHKAELFQWAKGQEQARKAALEGMRERSGPNETRVLKVQRWWYEVAKCSVVRRLNGEQLRLLFSNLDLVEYERGDTVVEQGSQEGKLLLLIRGTIEALLEREEGTPTSLRAFGSGDVIGEMATLENKSWPATYRAKEKSAVLVLTREGLEEALRGNPDPRGFLDALREQRKDRDLSDSILKMTRGR